MRPRRKLIAPLLLVGGVAAATLALFGPGAGAQTSASTTSSSSIPDFASTTTSVVTNPSTSTTSTVGSTNSAYPYNASSQVPTSQASSSATPAQIGYGRSMFIQTCASCHGLSAEGSVRAPTLAGLGAATVDFWVSTGRMPLESPTVQPVRKKPLFTSQQARDIAEYVASLEPGGPAIPKVNLSHTDLARGGTLFREDCATCHSYLGVGGALDYGASAPSLYQATPTQIAEAIRTGPANMPRFGPKNISDQDMNNIIRYVKYITKPNDRGGLELGHIGPVTEGFIGIVFGVGLMMLAAYWIGDRA